VIAPTSPSGGWFAPHDDPWVRAATVLLHGIAPLLVVADYLGAQPPSSSTLKAAISSLWWPISYLTVMSLLAWGGLVQMPYRFLSSSASCPALVVCAIAGLAAISAGLAAALQKTSSLLTARTGGSGSGTVSAVRRPFLVHARQVNAVLSHRVGHEHEDEYAGQDAQDLSDGSLQKPRE
jgi:hypothetical protein